MTWWVRPTLHINQNEQIETNERTNGILHPYEIVRRWRDGRVRRRWSRLNGQIVVVENLGQMKNITGRETQRIQLRQFRIVRNLNEDERTQGRYVFDLMNALLRTHIRARSRALAALRCWIPPPEVEEPDLVGEWDWLVVESQLDRRFRPIVKRIRRRNERRSEFSFSISPFSFLFAPFAWWLTCSEGLFLLLLLSFATASGSWSPRCSFYQWSFIHSSFSFVIREKKRWY